MREYRKIVDKIRKREKKDWTKISDIFSDTFEGYRLSDQFMEVSLKKFLEHLPIHEVEDAMAIACRKKSNNHNIAIKYFCGICWHKIKAGKE